MSDGENETLSSWIEQGALVARRGGRAVGIDLRPLNLQFTDDQTAKLAEFPHVESLELAGTAISDAGLSNLVALAKLAHLDLQRTAVTDAGLAALSGLKSLKILLLAGSQVTRDGIRQARRVMLGVRIVWA